MIGALLIVFREVIEAGLIVGIVLAATRGARGSRLWIGGARWRASSEPRSSRLSPKR